MIRVSGLSSLQRDYAGADRVGSRVRQAAVANEAHQALVKAVTDQGLSVDEYTSIVQAGTMPGFAKRS
jgi:hypothetical protein